MIFYVFSNIYVKFWGKSRDGGRAGVGLGLGVLFGLGLRLGFGFGGAFKTFIMNFEVQIMYVCMFCTNV